ncbi:uncharacterized protein LOC116292826 isoform X2 [Actinia tenebrosa]|uniref:Uncharacterized protein LOC116292826 isoform X2 n=1 Tax=Actinia tenebrosa TaxID=6105 RepID=A0A6P8HTM1_ACTTE|nr:uncharacterized protein LOC116292826 isoform X2 [Actinia tenebrosa]
MVISIKVTAFKNRTNTPTYGASIIWQLCTVLYSNMSLRAASRNHSSSHNGNNSTSTSTNRSRNDSNNNSGSTNDYCIGTFKKAREELKKVALKALFKLRKEMGNSPFSIHWFIGQTQSAQVRRQGTFKGLFEFEPCNLD